MEIIEGTVIQWDGYYDYADVVDENKRSLLIPLLLEKFRGKKVKVTVEEVT